MDQSLHLRRLFVPLLILLVVATSALVIVGLLMMDSQAVSEQSGASAGREPPYLALLIIWIVILALCALYLYRFARRTEQPILEIQDAALHFANGELDYTLPPDPTNGLSDVVDGLNTMAEHLRKRIEVLTRQQNEQRAILAGMVEAVIVLDTNLEIIDVNPAACRLMNMEPAAAKRRSLLEVFRNLELYNFAQETVSSRQAREANISLIGPERRFLQVHGTVLRHDSPETGQIADRVVLVLNDITKLKSLENVRKDFVANVSHELKTPITSIKGFIETLSDGAIDDPATTRRFLAIIANQTDRLQAIIDDLLSLSRLEQSEGRQLEVESFDLCQILGTAIMVCGEKAERRSIRIALRCGDLFTVVANPVLLEQAVINLVDNAVKFSQEGGTVTVEARRELGSIDIAVSDRGIGIPQKDLPRIFERFYRVEKARSRDLGGTGLGLAIVKHIALSHKGEVLVESTLGEGSTFTIRLPDVPPSVPLEMPAAGR